MDKATKEIKFIANCRTCEQQYQLLSSSALSVLESDRDILQRICYDFNDAAMMERFRPSLEEAKVITSQTMALDFMGSRGSAVNVSRTNRIMYAKKAVLQKNFLPHMSQRKARNLKKRTF